MKKKQKYQVNRIVPIVLLVMVLSVTLLRGDATVCAENQENLPNSLTIMNVEQKNRSVGQGESGTLNLKGSPITSKVVPIIREWDIYGIAKAEHQLYIRLYSSDRSAPYSVYCMDYGKGANTGTILDGSSLDAMGAEQKKLLSACLSFGFCEQSESLNDVQKAQYAATQAMVWTIMADLFQTQAGDHAAEQYLSYVDDVQSAMQFYFELKEKILTYEHIPSFTTRDKENAPLYELKWNSDKKRYETIVEDVEELTAKSEFQNDAGVEMEINGSKVTLYTEQTIVEPVMCSGIRKDINLKECVMYWNEDESVQRFGVCDIHTSIDSQPFYMQVKTEEADIVVEKVDAETGEAISQGSGASFEGTIYDLFGETYKEGDTKESVSFIGEMILDKEGKGKKEHLPVQTYYIKERSAPTGYLVDEKVHKVAFPLTEYDISPVSAHVTSKENVIRGDVELLKFGQDEQGEETEIKRPLDGIEFTFTSMTNGNKYVITTDKSGYASTKQLGNARGGLVFDTYLLEETKGKEGFKTIEPITISITEEGRTLRYIVEDKVIRAALKIQKVDKETGKIIPVKGTEFQIFDEKGEQVIMHTFYPKKEEHKSFVTDDTGTLMLPELLDYGTYKLVEVKAPEGYLISEPIAFTIQEMADYDTPLIITCADENIRGEIHILKTDADTKKPLSGIEFAIRAKEDIITLDGTVRVKKGELLETLVTKEDGTAKSGQLYMGIYLVQEVKAKEGYVTEMNPQEVVLEGKDQNTPVITYKLRIKNKPTRIDILKKEKGKDTLLSGVRFAIWEKPADIDAPMPEKKTYITDKKGTITCKYLLPGTYCIQEIETVAGYILDDSIREIMVDDTGRINGKEEEILVVENEKIVPPIPKEREVPKTGDTNRLIVLMVFLFLSCVTLLVCAKISSRDR